MARYFTIKVRENAISGTYEGGRIRIDQQVGRATGPDSIELLFQCLTTECEMLTGSSGVTIGIDHGGLITLTYIWS